MQRSVVLNGILPQPWAEGRLQLPDAALSQHVDGVALVYSHRLTALPKWTILLVGSKVHDGDKLPAGSAGHGPTGRTR